MSNQKMPDFLKSLFDRFKGKKEKTDSDREHDHELGELPDEQTVIDDSNEDTNLDDLTDEQVSFDPPNAAKRKKMIGLGIVGIGFVLFAVAMTSQNDNKPTPQVAANPVKKETPKAELPPALDVTSLIEESARQDVVSERQKRNEELAQLRKELREDVKKSVNEAIKDINPNQQSADADATSTPVGDNEVGQTRYYPPPIAGNNGTAQQGYPGVNGQMPPGYVQQPQFGSSFVVVSGRPFNFQKSTSESSKSNSMQLDSNESLDDLDSGEFGGDSYVPSGSFIKGKILTGADVPAPIGKSADPYPILIHLTGDSFGPNRTHRKVKECFIVASGRGDISLERAIFRTNTLSCEYEDGSKLDTEIKGYIVDTDGRAGLRGEVDTRNGSKLAMTLIASFAEGFGQNAALAGQTQTVTSAGIATTTDPNQLVKSSSLAGVGTAAGKLAEHYSKMAEAIYPVIKIPAVRDVTVVVLTGFSLEPNISPKGGNQ